MRSPLSLTLAAALISLLPVKAMETKLPAYDASDRSAPPLTAETSILAERFWPYQVRLVNQPKRQTLPLEMPGILIRAEPDGLLLIDFGRDGLHRIAPEHTDMLASAEAIRLGKATKDAPNFTYQIGARLVRADSDKLEPLPFSATTNKAAYLCAFVPVEGTALERILSALPAGEIGVGVMPILFPLGEQPDHRVRARLRGIERPWAFVYDHLSDSYAPGLLPPDLSPPAVLLLSAEGRIISSTGWDEGAPARIASWFENTPSATP